MSTVIYHNPACGTSRNVLAMIHAAGVEPKVIEYLKTPPSRDDIIALTADMENSVRGLLRRKGTPFDELGLADETLSDAALLDALMAHPILLERPIVVSPLGARLCRPAELVLQILPHAPA